MATITNESEEMQLETIYRLKSGGKDIRSIDIAKEMGYSKASVSIGMKILLNKEYIVYNDDKTIKLTELGIKEALKVYERHIVLKQVLMSLGASESLAEDDGCKIEHVISDDLLKILKDYLSKMALNKKKQNFEKKLKN